MAGADYSVVNPPGGVSYAPPLMAAFLQRGISDIPDQYFQGTQQKRQLALQKPVLDPQTGQPIDPSDPRAAGLIMSEGAKRGGLEWMQGLMPYILENQASAPVIGALGGNAPGSSTATSQPSNNHPAGAGPANFYPASQRPAQTIPSEDAGYSTIAEIGTSLAGGREVGPILQRVATSMGKTSTADPLSSAEQKIAKDRISGALGLRNAQRPAASSITPPGNEGETSAGPTSAADAGPGTPGSRLPQQGASGGPGPTTSPTATETTAKPSGIAPQGTGDKTLGGLIPQSFIDQGGTASGYRDLLAQLAARPRISPNAKAIADQRVKAIDEALAKNAELTPKEKEAGRGQPAILAAERESEIQKQKIARSGKTYSGMQAQTTQYERDLKPMLQITQSLLNRPEMWSGTGGDISLALNRAKAVFGDQNAALLQEALQKVTATSVLGQINLQKDQMQESGSTSTRIFSTQVDLVQKAAPALVNTVSGNRFLVNVAMRMGELNTQVTRKAQEYMAKNGILDEGFDRQISDYLTAHPVFSKLERDHPAVLGAPDVPSSVVGKSVEESKAKMAAWEETMGLKPGDWIRPPVGPPRQIPHITVTAPPGSAVAATPR